MVSDRVLDAYTHFIPPGYLEEFRQLSRERGLVKRQEAIPLLYDVELRRRFVGERPGYQQVLTPCPPGPELVGDARDHPRLARMINDGLAEVCRRHPDAFPAFVACLPLDDVDAALPELRHAAELGARGVQLYTNVLGKPLDSPEFAPLFAELEAQSLPAWLHPARSAGFADYGTEDRSRYEIWQVLGWPFETAACIARLVFSGVMDRHPGLTVVTHHLGGVIPYLEGRIGPLWDRLGTRTEGGEYQDTLASLKRRPLDYFRELHADTAVGPSAGAIRCGLDFFAPDRVVFASDCPFFEDGPGGVDDTIANVRSVGLAPDALAAVTHRNACKLLRID